MNYSEWLDSITKQASLPIYEDNGIIKVAVETDRSILALEHLANLGYSVVKWIKSNEPCEICKDLDGKTWEIHNFIDTATHDAAIFSKSHCGCRCFVEVKAITNGEESEYRGPIVLEATK